MSTPNPLIPQGSLQSSGSSNVRIAVATIVAIHVVFFGGLLLQGCKRDPKPAAAAPETNAETAAMSYPPIETNSLYYPSPSSLPQDTRSTTALAPTNPAVESFAPPRQTNVSARDPWQQAATAPTRTVTPSSSAPGAPMKEHTVVRGDTYTKIARDYGTTISALQRANPGIDPAKIRPGMKLNVPGPEAAASAGSASGASNAGNGNGNVYVVKSGDTLTKIARAHGVTVGQLREANDLRVSRINVGQKLKIPAGGTNRPSGTAPSPTPTF